MSDTRKTCDRCAHYTPSPTQDNRGGCALMGDINKGENDIDRCSGFDYEGYQAGVCVGPKFGCIHWSKKP